MEQVASAADRGSLFKYDEGAPLDTRVIGTSSEAGSRVQDIEFRGGGRTVRAYRIDPLFTLPLGRVLFLHPAPGDRSSFLPDARLLAERGISSLLVDAPWADPRFGERAGGMSAAELREMFVGAVIDVRRGADLLTSGLPRKNVGFVGHSLGAMIGGVLSSVDRRFRALVLLAGPPRFVDVARLNAPGAPQAWFDEYAEATAPIDPVGHVRGARDASFLFQLGLDDRSLPRARFMELFDAAAGQKDIYWYQADHFGVSEAGRADRIEWIDARVPSL